MGECNHDCSHCSSNCGQKEYKREDFLIKANERSNVKKVIGVVSGKGGVGKSMVTSLLAVACAKAGYKTAILDADITGPSIPQAFGLTERLCATETDIVPAYTALGIKVVSTNLVLEKTTQPVLWRGAILSGVVKQFYSEVDWGDVDYMFVDMPPGTGDVNLTTFQSIPLDGIIIVSTPQSLVSMIVEKAVNMAEMMKVNVLGIVENMSYVECDNCGNRIELFGSSKSKQLAESHNTKLLAQLPLNSTLTSLVDNGLIENAEVNYLDSVIEELKNI